MPDPRSVRELTGWGNTAPTAAQVSPARSLHEVRETLRTAGPRGVIARGLGRSYGDAAQNAGGTVLCDVATDTSVDIDVRRGIVSAPAGLSLDTLQRMTLPQGWFVPVTPGTRFVTLGGAFAADVHGKNHHVDGSFARHVIEVDLVTAEGRLHTLTPADPSGIFWATAGGMGLTGVVVRLRLHLRRVTSTWMRVDTTRADDLDDVLATLERGDRDATYSVAWVDLLARGRRTGRGVVTNGEHVDGTDCGSRAPAVAPPSPPRLTAPRVGASLVLNRASVRAFNEAWFRRSPTRRGELQSMFTFFYPLDGVGHWNRFYGRHGMVQHQVVVPFDARSTLEDLVTRLVRRRAPAYLAVLKRLGPGDAGPMSFPQPGWTLTVDFPASWSGLGLLLDELDLLVASAGGAVYLAKDSRMRPELIPAMYPRVGEFRELRARLDPGRVFMSDLARRLDL